MPENSQTIIQLLALGPETIKVDAAAAIDGKSTLDIGAAIKGSFELIAPFEISVDSSMTFIPNQSTIIDEWQHDTRQKLRNFVSEALMTSSVKNGFPIGGDISVLMSDRDIFPTGSSDSTLATWRDSLVKDTENGVNDTTLSPTKWTAEHTLEVLTNKCDDLMKMMDPIMFRMLFMTKTVVVIPLRTWFNTFLAKLILLFPTSIHY